MTIIGEKVEALAGRYDIQIIYAFGSRAKEALHMLEGRTQEASPGKSDLDIGVKAERPLSVQEKVDIAIAFEDLFAVPRVDVVGLAEAPVFLALEIVQGELLYAKDSTYEAEYQLYVMRGAADLMPYERMKRKMLLGIEV
jgi:hypothetical protein